MPLEREFDRWRQRLLSQKRVFVDQGLTESNNKIMREMIRMYRGEQWFGSWRGLEEEQLRVVNKVFPFANQQQASIISRNPRTLYTARKEDDELLAPAVQELHDYDIREQNHKRQLQAAFRVHQFAPFGCIRHGYTPEEEAFAGEGEKVERINFYRNSNKNRPWIRSVLPWNVLFDTRVDDLSMDGGMQWVAFRDVISKDVIRQNPKMINRDKLAGIQGKISEDILQDVQLQAGDPDLADLVEVWSVYEIKERTWFQMCLEGVDDYLRKPTAWPIPWEWLPGHFFTVNEQLDTPFPLSLLEQMAPLQREYNQVRTMIHQGVLRSRRQNFYNKLALEDEEATAASMAENAEWVGVKGDPRTAVFPGQTGGLPADVINMLAVVESDLRETLAQSKMSRGERVNVESGSEAQFINQGQQEGEARIEDAFLDFTRDVEAGFMQGRRYIMAKLGTAADEVVRIVGQKDGDRVTQYATVDAEVLHGDYDFEIEVGSMRPRNRDVEAQQAAVDLDIALKTKEYSNVPYFLRQYCQKRGHDPAQALNPQAQQAAQAGAEIAATANAAAPAAMDPGTLALLGQSGRR